MSENQDQAQDQAQDNAMDALSSALLQKTFKEGEKLVVRAEDIENEGSGINFSDHFFEPKPGNVYLIKLLPNPGGEAVTHRSVYKHLPDPTRKGKTFHFTSSGNSKTCLALELFFELFEMKKNGDPVAEKKIDKYMGRTNQACCKIQVLSSPEQSEIGIIRMMSFASFGPNATVAQMIDKKVNLSEEKLKQGFEAEDVFNIFGSSVISLDVREAIYDGNKGRDYTNSEWTPKKRGAIAIIPGVDGAPDQTYEFKESDLTDDGKLANPEVEKFFKAFTKQILNPDYDIHNYFAYKVPGDPRNTKESEEYLEMVNKKVEEIIPIIREKTLGEIAAYGKKAESTNGAKPDAGKNVLSESIPDELKNSMFSEDANKTPETKVETKSDVKPEAKTETKTETKTDGAPSEEDILNS